MQQSAKRQLIEDRLGRPLADFVAERHRPYVRNSGWRTIAADVKEATGVVVSHETLRAWFDSADDGAAA